MRQDIHTHLVCIYPGSSNENIGELRASPPQEHYTPESYAEFVQRHEKFLHDQPLPGKLQFDIIHKDGSIRHTQISSKEMLWNGKQQFHKAEIKNSPQGNIFTMEHILKLHFVKMKNTSTWCMMLSNYPNQIKINEPANK